MKHPVFILACCAGMFLLASCGNSNNRPAQTDSSGRTIDSGAVQTHTTNSAKADTSEVDSKQIAENENFQKFKDKAQAKDAQLVVDVVADNINQIRLAQLALQQSPTPAVHQFAQQLLQQHSQLLDTLRAYALRKNISVPTGGAKEANEGIRQLSQKKPEDFDKAWTSTLKDRHAATISAFKKAAKEATDAELKKIILNAEPQLQAHANALKSLEKTTVKNS